MRRIGDLGGWVVAVPILALALVFVVYPLGNAILPASRNEEAFEIEQGQVSECDLRALAHEG